MMQPTARNAFPVLDWIMSRHVHEYLDVAGRPLGEGRSVVFEQVQTEMRSCPYAGSRYHHAKPMNVTALQQMPAWQHILNMLTWLSQRYRAAHQTEITTCADLAQVTSAGVFLVDFLVLRQHHPLHSREIPLLISGLYKVCLGFQLAYLPEQYAHDTTPTQLPDPAGFLAYLEENELLIGEAEVCAGPAAMIMQAYEAIIGRHTLADQALLPPCTSLEIGWEEFDVFTHHAASIWHELVRFAIETQAFCPKLADSRLPPDVQGRLNFRLEQGGTELLAGRAGLVVDIARAVHDCGVRSDVAHSPTLPEALGPSSRSELGSLAATVLSWLNVGAAADMQAFGPVVASALQPQLTRYEIYEETVLAGLNQHLNCLIKALGLDVSSEPLTASALSRVCGRTLRDWGAPVLMS